MKRIVRYLMICAIAMTAGCSHVDEYISVAKRAVVSDSYYDVLNAWTREKTVYSQFETVIRVVATLQSDEFMNACRAEYTRAYMPDVAPPSPERDAIMAPPAAGNAAMLLYVYMPDKEANNLASPGSLWQLGLVGEPGETVVPGEIRQIETITPLIEKLFPYVNKYYGKFYRVTFAAPASLTAAAAGDGTAKKMLTLTCAGILGRAELVWELQSPR